MGWSHDYEKVLFLLLLTVLLSVYSSAPKIDGRHSKDFAGKEVASATHNTPNQNDNRHD
ncbi:hypothetical protein JSQ81_15565 [Sporosarcina sp. Marseille-Q4063]|uniref:hypothetical protein n=1 Tax=Sporosarcina sp. Marseille-Q4063 TaxID=2810514 RepID=UPI001BAEF7CC|nr:hypothetical protein [Sporosarcina sp. Marseille-Q4063]QUW21213.1 hypothetical protein JSQ81_15565 [Sporosarcina sp. Marseille-Q4063]